MSQIFAFISYRPCQSPGIQFYETNLSCFSNQLIVVNMECGEEEVENKKGKLIMQKHTNPYFNRLWPNALLLLFFPYQPLATSKHHAWDDLPALVCSCFSPPLQPNYKHCLLNVQTHFRLCCPGFDPQLLSSNAIINLWITTKACHCHHVQQADEIPPRHEFHSII